MLITFLIPAFKRHNGALRAALSILNQCTSNCKGKVGVWINDDKSPNFNLNLTKQTLAKFESVADINVSQNPVNLGMSRNILYMVGVTSSVFWTVVTDDDLMSPNSLPTILKILSAADKLAVGAILTPRYCYTEDGVFQFRGVDNNVQFPSILSKGAVSSLSYIKHAHVLTGLFLKSGLDLSSWQRHIENAYFPMINFASCLLDNHCLAVDYNWFHHTINNTTHWDEWGNSKAEQTWRTNLDYITCFNFARLQATSHSKTLYTKLHVNLVYSKHICAIYIELFRKYSIVRVFRIFWQSTNASAMLRILLPPLLVSAYFAFLACHAIYILANYAKGVFLSKGI